MPSSSAARLSAFRRFGEAAPCWRFGEAQRDPRQHDRYSHACPFARIMEEGLCRRLVQVGIRTMTLTCRQADRFGVELGPDACADVPVESLEGPLYVSLDLDGLDPAFAPGVSHPEPGGLSVRDVVRLLHRVRAPIIGADVVEYNPLNDLRDLTARGWP